MLRSKDGNRTSSVQVLRVPLNQLGDLCQATEGLYASFFHKTGLIDPPRVALRLRGAGVCKARRKCLV